MSHCKKAKLELSFLPSINLYRAPRRDKAEAAAADAAKAEKERNASGGSGGGNALTRGGKSIRKKIRASFRMKSTRKGCLIHIRVS